MKPSIVTIVRIENAATAHIYCYDMEDKEKTRTAYIEYAKRIATLYNTFECDSPILTVGDVKRTIYVNNSDELFIVMRTIKRHAEKARRDKWG